MRIKVLYLLKNFYTFPKQISGYAPGSADCACDLVLNNNVRLQV